MSDFQIQIRTPVRGPIPEDAAEVSTNALWVFDSDPEVFLEIRGTKDFTIARLTPQQARDVGATLIVKADLIDEKSRPT
jgi:hypothetical protein